jgi:pilus assembly protein CpaE
MDTAPSVQIGILAPSKIARTRLHEKVVSLRLGSVIVESEDFPTSPVDLSLTLWRQAAPNVIFVVSSNAEEIISTVTTLHQALPWAWLLVISEIRDTQVILQTVRAGAREFLNPPILPDNLHEAMERFHNECNRDKVKKIYGKVFGVVSAKGGAGTTTTAVNLATSIASMPATKVAVIDLGYPLGDAAALMDARPQFSVFDAFKVGSRLDTVLLESYITNKHGISLLAAPMEVEERALPDQDTFRETLKVVTETFTHAVVDVPSHLDLEYLHAFSKMCTQLLVVVTPELLSLWKTHRLLNYMNRWDIPGKLKLVVNKNDRSEEITTRQIQKMLDLKISWSLPFDYDSAIHAINHGKPLVRENNSSLATAFGTMAEELTGLTLPQKRKAGLFSGFMRKKQKASGPKSSLLEAVSDTSSEHSALFVPDH